MSQIKIFSSFECFFNFKFAMTYEIILDHWITGHYQFNTESKRFGTILYRFVFGMILYEFDLITAKRQSINTH